jgi:tetrahydromethanopterin S-methyltransferase subunit E
VLITPVALKELTLNVVAVVVLTASAETLYVVMFAVYILAYMFRNISQAEFQRDAIFIKMVPLCRMLCIT